MKNNYFLTWTQRTLFLLLLLAGFNVSAQSFLISGPAAADPKPLAQDLTVCNGDSLYTVKLTAANASTTGASVIVQLPTGIKYLSGSVAKIVGTAALTIAENGGGANAPNFLIRPNALPCVYL